MDFVINTRKSTAFVRFYNQTIIIFSKLFNLNNNRNFSVVIDVNTDGIHFLHFKAEMSVWMSDYNPWTELSQIFILELGKITGTFLAWLKKADFYI